MCSRQESAAKSVNYLRKHCCKGLFSRCPISCTGSFLPCIRAQGRLRRSLCASATVRTIPQDIQAGQQEPRREVTPIDAAIEGYGTDLYPLRIQSFSQLPVAPVARLHSAFYPQTCLKPPIRHSFRLRLGRSGFRVKGKWATNQVHFRKTLFHWSQAGQLKTLLSHTFSGCLYLNPCHEEVNTHA